MAVTHIKPSQPILELAGTELTQLWSQETVRTSGGELSYNYNGRIIRSESKTTTTTHVVLRQEPRQQLMQYRAPGDSITSYYVWLPYLYYHIKDVPDVGGVGWHQTIILRMAASSEPVDYPEGEVGIFNIPNIQRMKPCYTGGKIKYNSQLDTVQERIFQELEVFWGALWFGDSTQHQGFNLWKDLIDRAAQQSGKPKYAINDYDVFRYWETMTKQQVLDLAWLDDGYGYRYSIDRVMGDTIANNY